MHGSRHQTRLWSAIRLTGDMGVGATALYAAFLLRIRVPLPFTDQLLPSERLALAAATGGLAATLLAQLAVLYVFGFYDPPEPEPRVELARRLLPAMGLLGLVLASYFFLTEQVFPRSVIVVFVALDYLLLLLWRSLFAGLQPTVQRRVALVGCGPAAVEIADKIRQFGHHGLVVVGHVEPPDETAPATAEEIELLGPRLGTVADLPDLVRDGRVDELILASSVDDWRTRLIDALAAVRPFSADVLLLPRPFEALVGRLRYRWVRDVPLIEVVKNSEWRINRPLKRVTDLLLGSLMLLLSLPLLALCAAAVKLTSQGSVLYRQQRVGRGRRPFQLYKLRTMHLNAEAGTGEVLAQPDDPRLTAVGAALRRYRLDELPQLWNVLNGTMSLVGPRPERPGFVSRYLAEVPGYAERFAVAPGLTGLAQINGEYLSSAHNKLRYDLAYVANWSMWLDVSILLRTVKIVLTSQGT